MEKTKVGIIIPAHNLAWMTVNCLESILACTDQDQIVVYLVDNGSVGGELDLVGESLQKFINKKLILTPNNQGFVKATNTGIKVAMNDGCTHVCLLNNDTVVTTGWLDRMLRTLMIVPSAGIIGTMTSPPDWNQTPQAKNIIKSKALYDSFKQSMEGYAANLAIHFKGMAKQKGFVPFMCALITREVIQKVGLLSEDYSLGLFDDNDYCTRARLAGFTMWLCQDSYVHHFWHSTFTADNVDYFKLLEENRKVFINKHGFDPWEKEQL